MGLKIFIILILLGLPANGQITDEKLVDTLRYYVSTNGNDTWKGTLERPSTDNSNGPFKTLKAARNAIRNLNQGIHNKQSIEVCLLPGIHILEETFELNAMDSGSQEFPIVYKALENKKTVISGGVQIRHWRQAKLNGREVLIADLTEIKGYRPFEQMWVNSKRAIQARTPNRGQYFQVDSVPYTATDEDKPPSPGYRFVFNETDKYHFKNFKEGVAVVFNKWLEYHMPLKNIDLDNLTFTSSKKSLRPLLEEDYYYLEGDKSMLDQEGEWYLARKAKKLYYIPRPGETDVVAIIPLLTTVVLAKGNADEDDYVEYLKFEGLTFSHTTFSLDRDKGPSGFQQASVPVEGAIRLMDARNITIQKCEITNIGNYGVEIGPGCVGNKILKCKFHALGAGGIQIGPKIRPESEREDPRRNDYEPVLANPKDATRFNEVADCSIYDGGLYYHDAVGIWVGQSSFNQIHHNEIYDFYYSGISSGWTWGYAKGLARGNRFEFNHVHHIGERMDGDGAVLSDMGAIYTLGDQTGSVIRNNIFHDIKSGKYGGFGIYLDEGSRYLLVENNLVYNCKHNCFLQHYGKDNVIRNNILAFSGKSLVGLAKDASHISFNLTNNILLNKEETIYSGGYRHTVETPNSFIADRNMVWSMSGVVNGAQDQYFPSRDYEPDMPMLSWNQWQELGYDENSIIKDPGFIDPLNGDFRFRNEETVKKIGFAPFPLDTAGPRNQDD